MGINKKQLMKLIKDDMEKYKNTLGRSLAGQFRDELTLTATNAMGAFYGDYPAKKYKRHYYNFMENSFRSYYSNPHNTIFRGGVELTPSAMDSIYDEPVEIVFNDVFELGYHGPQDFAPAQMSPSPLRIVLDKQNEIYKNPMKYIDKAKKVADGGNYTVLKFG